jgi:hypothetical protein
MQTSTTDPRLLSILNWTIIASVVALIVRFVAKAVIMRGARISTIPATVLFLGSAGVISAACTVGALMMFGPIAVVGWLFASLLFAGYFATKANSRNEREEWLRMEMSFIDATTAGGLIVGSIAAAAILRYLKFV